MSSSIVPAAVRFKAHWTPANQHLKSSVPDKIKRVSSFFLQYLASRLILQTSSMSKRHVYGVEKEFNAYWYGTENERRSLRKTFSATPLQLETPDGATISGTYLKHKHAPENAKTILLFQPNACLSKAGAFDWILHEAQERKTPVNFVLFDYRGCGMISRDRAWNAKQVILDGETIYQFAQNHLKIPEHSIDFYGYSFGGGIGAEVKNLHRENTGKVLSERSFITLEQEIRCLLPRLFSFSAAKLATLIGWSIDATKGLKNSLGSKMIIYHPKDPIVPYRASVAHFFQKNCPEKKEVEVVKLDKAYGYIGNHHCIPLTAYADRPLTPAQRAADFLLLS